MAGLVAVTPFSHFSAASELFVTAGVFYFFYQAVRHDRFRWGFIAILLAFETLVNITYMSSRIVQSGPTSDRPAWATWLLAGHGTLSLLMFLGLIAFVMLAFRHARVEKENYFRERMAPTWVFLALWTVSVLSGEALYVLQLTGAMEI